MLNFKVLCYEEREFNLKALKPHLGDFLPFEPAPKLRDLELRLATNPALCGLFRPHILRDDAHNYYFVDYMNTIPAEELGHQARHMSRLVPMPKSGLSAQTLYDLVSDLRKGNPIEPFIATTLLDDEPSLVELYELLGKFSLATPIINTDPFFRGAPATRFFNALIEGLNNNYKKAFGCFFKSSTRNNTFYEYYEHEIGITTSWVAPTPNNPFSNGYVQLKFLLHAYEAGCIPIGSTNHQRGMQSIYAMHRINNAKGYTRENTIYLAPTVHSELHLQMRKEGVSDSLPLLIERGYLPLLERYNSEAKAIRQGIKPFEGSDPA